MILQALKEYYDRQPDLPRMGWERKAIPFLLVINEKGKFVCLQDTREPVGKQLRAREFVVPALGEKKGNGIKANLFWENIEYLLGIPAESDERERDPARVAQQHAEFCRRVKGVKGDCITLLAAKAFLDNADRAAVQSDPMWSTVAGVNQPVLIALQGSGPVTDDIALRDAIDKSRVLAGSPGWCLVTGEKDVITALEPPVRGVRDANPTGASLVSINNKVSNGSNAGAMPAFASFLKEQGHNSPIGKKASFAYTTALNTLLSKDSRQKLLVGDATTVFWSAKRSDLEGQVCSFFDEPPKDNPDQLVEAVKSLYRSVDIGGPAFDGDDTRFYVLGLSPNAARIAVRFWHCGTVAEMAGRFREYFDDMRIVHGPRDRDHMSLWRLLVSTAAQGKSENIPPNIAGDTMRAILEGLPYPQTLLQAAIRRIRAEQAKKNKTTGKSVPSVTHERAALIKACINRATRSRNPNIKEELKVSLDESNSNIGYRLGRLFAALEKIQQEASPGINATIRDRFYGAASSTPVTVFPTLVNRLMPHHLAKLPTGRRIFFERLVGQIQDAVDGQVGYPPTLSLDNQGRFAIGYYHQTQKLFEKKSNTTTKKETVL